MQYLSASTFELQKFPERTPVWILLTGLAFCATGMVTAFAATDIGTRYPAQFSAAVDFLAPSSTPPQQLW